MDCPAYWVLGILGLILQSWTFDHLSAAFFTALIGLACAAAVLSRSRVLCLVLSLVLLLLCAKALLEMYPLFEPALVIEALISFTLSIFSIIAAAKSFRYHRLTAQRKPVSS
jgi:hypothetical protein